ncbi:MAG: TonB family protein [Gammaproteobacteria bacterium]|nr:TonB family protein [Gammaproteobacteria bacterium]
MPIIRYISTFVVSCILTLMLFILMQKLLNFENHNIHKTQELNGLDFVRLIREPREEKIPYKTQPPEQPQRPKQKKPPPKLEQLKVKKPVLDSIVLPRPRLQTNLNLNDALYLGEYQKNTPIQKNIEIDEEVVPLVRISPVYPSRAARIGIEGWVKMEVFIDSSGSVEKVKVLDAHPSNIFNRAAIKAMKRWRFRPKMVAGKAVPRIAEQQMNFKLQK